MDKPLLKETIMLMAALPKCKHVFLKANGRGRQRWTIVRFYVQPSDAKPEDMHQVGPEFPFRTDALNYSGTDAMARIPHGIQKGHKAVWKIQQDGKVFWEVVWPLELASGKLLLS